MKIQFIFDEVQNFAVGNNCAQLIIDALNWTFLPHRRNNINVKCETRPRNCHMCLLAIGGIGHSTNSHPISTMITDTATTSMPTEPITCSTPFIELFSNVTKKWTTMPCNFELPHGCAIIELNSDLFVLGGCEHNNRSTNNVR